jgi:hypothetical protein
MSTQFSFRNAPQRAHGKLSRGCPEICVVKDDGTPTCGFSGGGWPEEK